MNKITYVNGDFVSHEDAKIHIDDRGLQFSDGVYEVIYIKDNILIDWDLHLTRLRKSVEGLLINYIVDSDELKSIVSKLLTENNLTSAFLYLQVSRGVSPRNHAFPETKIEPSLVMTVTAANLDFGKKEYIEGASLITHPDIRWKRRDLKTISLLPNILAKQKSVEAGAIEAILVEENGDITEGSSTNFFIINKNGILQTHPANNLILGGITRLGVIEVAKKLQIEVIQEPFKMQDVLDAKESFITSTTKHIMPTTQIDNSKIADGKVGEISKNLMSSYADFIEQQKA